jgi:hypothetical protein
VGVEKPGQSVGRGVRSRDWQDVGDWPPVHMLLNVPGPNYVGACERMTPLSQVEGDAQGHTRPADANRSSRDDERCLPRPV